MPPNTPSINHVGAMRNEDVEEGILKAHQNKPVPEYKAKDVIVVQKCRRTSNGNGSNSIVGTDEEDELISISDSNEINVADIEASPTVTKVYKRRIWILFLFSTLTCFVCIQWNAYGPISASMFAVFPNWNPGTIALMENWMTAVFVFMFLPACYAAEYYGIRPSILYSVFILVGGMSLRCISDTAPQFTIMCHVCAFVLGVSMTLILSAPPMVAAVWFPPGERTTAVAVMIAASNLGIVGSYMEPLVVREPAEGVPIDLIRADIMRLMYIAAGFGWIVFLLMVVYFPSKPPLPPSFTSSTERLNFIQGCFAMLKNTDFMSMVVAYGITTGPSLAWVGVLNFSLAPLGFSQDDAMYVGLSAVISSFVLALIAGWLTDKAYGYLKETIIGLLLASCLAYYWFLLLLKKMIPFSRWQVYVSTSLGLSMNFATIPLFFEMAVEVAYPVQEVLVGGVVTGSDSLFSSIFLCMYLLQSTDFLWVSYTLVGSNALGVVLLLLITIKYRRAKLDVVEPVE